MIQKMSDYTLNDFDEDEKNIKKFDAIIKKDSD